MSHPNRPVRYRRRGTGTPTSSTRFVRTGEKDFYDWTNPADCAEYQIVLRYRQQ